MMKNRIILGKIDYIGNGRKDNQVDIEIELKDTSKGKELSISGNIWKASHNDILCGGQCLDEINRYFKHHVLFAQIYYLWKTYHLNGMHPECEHQRELGWRELASQKVNLYYWTLKSAALNEKTRIEKQALKDLKGGKSVKLNKNDKELLNLEWSITTYIDKLPKKMEQFYEPKKSIIGSHTETKTLGWLSPTEHPHGILGKECPTCGYKYGTEWKYMPISDKDMELIQKVLSFKKEKEGDE